MIRGTRSVLLFLLTALPACPQACPSPQPDAGVPDAGGPVDAGPDADPFHDPLSTPAEPTLDTTNFSTAQTCGECHQQHYQDWRRSMHAYAMVDPIFRGLVAERQAAFAGEQDQFCVQCHSPIGTRGGAIVDNFSFEDLDEVVLEGVTCESCHKAVAVERPYNSGYRIDQFAPMQGPIADPEDSLFHASAKTELLAEPRFCASCHDVEEVSGLNLERPYEEYLESPGFEEGRTCQECHMPTFEGQAVVDGPIRELRRHAFLGVDVPLIDGYLSAEEMAEVEQDVEELLQSSAELSLQADPLTVPGGQIDLFVHVENLIDSHNLPTGSTFIRQMWVEVTATDDEGAILYQTGDLDENGDLRDAFSEVDPYGDNDLIKLSSSLLDETGAPVLFTWEATEHVTSSLSPLYQRTWTLFLPVPDEVTGPVHVEARLLFRTHGPYLLRALDLDELIDKLRIYEVDAADVTVDVVQP